MTRNGRVESVIFLLFFVIVAIVFLTSDVVKAGHADGRILAYLSDATVYHKHYVDRFANAGVLENWTTFLRASPILMMMLFDGKIILVQLLNALVMMICLLASQRCFKTERVKFLYLFFCMVFPYFSFGFLGLNKEVYAMSSAMLYSVFIVSGAKRFLIASLVLALMARYYMLAPLIMLMLIFPRHRPPRYYLAGLSLVLVSIIGPLAKTMVPEYSYANLLEGSGRTAVIFSTLIDNFGYAAIYPIKYMILILVRPFGFFFAGNGDSVGAVVSVLSCIAGALAIYVFAKAKRNHREIGLFVLAGLLAPIPLMWSEIMHWRYYSFVYFFFIFAICIYMDSVRTGAPTLVPSKHDRTSDE
ncbi:MULTISPECIES: hypothetical protein [Rhizobium/Agrobacterium group]|uniref:hypothetical protein n=1 Tax=Rhizobium oryzihabitans TaxID=2267833 RepID=UPI0040331A2F